MGNKNLIPEIKRSRGYFVYDTNGNRYLDFYQDNGRAIFGHRMEGITRIIKSTVARGLTASYPSIYTHRVKRELNRLFPYVEEFRVYRNIERAMAAISEIEGETISIDKFVDFPSGAARFGIWRPFLDSSLKWHDFKYLIPILPFPGDFGPVVLALNKIDNSLALSDDISPMICDMLIKSISTVIKHSKNYNPADMSDFESPVWDRIGPYLRFKMEDKEYSVLFNNALRNSVLLPPEPGIPGIIPGYYEKGSIKDFMHMLRLVGSKLPARQCNPRGNYGS